MRMSASATDTTVCRGQTRDGGDLTSGAGVGRRGLSADGLPTRGSDGGFSGARFPHLEPGGGYRAWSLCENSPSRSHTVRVRLAVVVLR